MHQETTRKVRGMSCIEISMNYAHTWSNTVHTCLHVCMNAQMVYLPHQSQNLGGGLRISPSACSGTPNLYKDRAIKVPRILCIPTPVAHYYICTWSTLYSACVDVCWTRVDVCVCLHVNKLEIGLSSMLATRTNHVTCSSTE